MYTALAQCSQLEFLGLVLPYHTRTLAQLVALFTKLRTRCEPLNITLVNHPPTCVAPTPADWAAQLPHRRLLHMLEEAGGVEAQRVRQDASALNANASQARQLKGDESELLTLQACIYQARLGISPMLRAQKYSAMVAQTVAQAKELNPANPRAYLVAANNVYYTPKIFGGGAEAARPLYEQAKTKFEAFQPATPLAYRYSYALHRLL